MEKMGKEEVEVEELDFVEYTGEITSESNSNYTSDSNISQSTNNPCFAFNPGTLIERS